MTAFSICPSLKTKSLGPPSATGVCSAVLRDGSTGLVVQVCAWAVHRSCQLQFPCHSCYCALPAALSGEGLCWICNGMERSSQMYPLLRSEPESLLHTSKNVFTCSTVQGKLRSSLLLRCRRDGDIASCPAKSGAAWRACGGGDPKIWPDGSVSKIAVLLSKENSIFTSQRGSVSRILL